MGTKVVQVSDDDISYYTLPGSSGEIRREAGQIGDTVFGQPYESNQPGLINWRVSASAFYKGFAGYVCDLKKPGTSTAFTSEAMTLVSGSTYQITDTTKRIWNRNGGSFVVFDNAIDHSSDVESIDYLFGRVTFKSTYTVLTPVTVTGFYYPTAVLGKAQGFTLTQTAAVINSSYFDAVQTNGGYQMSEYGLKTVSLDLDNFYALSSGFAALLAAQTELVIEINPDGAGKSVARGFFKAVSQSQSGDVGALEREPVSFTLSVPDPSGGLGVSNVEVPFKWVFTAGSPALGTGVQKAVQAWQGATKLHVKYSADGVTGDKGQTVVSEVSLSSGLDAMNEFSCTFQGDGVLTAY